jgi:hypothetical protein
MSRSPCSPAAADRNLLFGVLALQMDFISREALIQAMNAWVLDKKKPLALILVEQGALAADAHALLESLVQKHLELHSNDPQQSLAAIPALGDLQRDLASVADPDVQTSLVTLPPTDDPHATRSSSRPSARNAGMRQLWTGLPSSQTVQAPQSPASHPFFTSKHPRPRRKVRKHWPGRGSAVKDLPLMR